MKDFLSNTWKHRAHVIMALPVFLILFFIMYVPLYGLTMAFREYDLMEGLLGSPWVGFKNFEFIYKTGPLFLRMTKNTLIYYVIFTAVGTFLNVTLAVALDQFVFKKAGKVMQTMMIIPIFISYAAVQFIVSAFLEPNGIFNSVFGTDYSFYSKSMVGAWPLILTIVKIWNSVGYGSVLYMSVLAGVDTSLYEAAEIDGANRWQRIWHITLPALIPMITVMLLLSVGSVMKSDTGLFYQVTKNIGELYETTQVVDSYVLDAIKKTTNMGYTGVASLFQSVVGLVLMLVANGTVRKIAPDDALF